MAKIIKNRYLQIISLSMLFILMVGGYVGMFWQGVFVKNAEMESTVKDSERLALWIHETYHTPNRPYTGDIDKEAKK